MLFLINWANFIIWKKKCTYIKDKSWKNNKTASKVEQKHKYCSNVLNLPTITYTTLQSYDSLSINRSKNAVKHCQTGHAMRAWSLRDLCYKQYINPIKLQPKCLESRIWVAVTGLYFNNSLCGVCWFVKFLALVLGQAPNANTQGKHNPPSTEQNGFVDLCGRCAFLISRSSSLPSYAFLQPHTVFPSHCSLRVNLASLGAHAESWRRLRWKRWRNP